ncbi:MAG TPA: DegT/DnrJ/EryC1/StrS family aminotransferase [Candidatus Omnitrophota bacterium]|nr:DegT/DnrJ/EryC1/StrS family aminotransferase [Candidatus Omnitrophota bacterium]HPD84128.1 DegT/DnrJ/EryC1/StrS family aminotransferase [Candidatus Omnitrophota bacterium]HRZ02985.1 DegT/DnrJ/EryC1/StrS family aminotransferase [Candidatus Omnitrophota bacterium]
MKVTFIDFTKQNKDIEKEVEKGFKQVIKDASFILGKDVARFEKEFSQYCGVSYGIGVNSGTDALHLAVRALDIGPGDEVILPSFTFIATALAVSYTGAKTVFADIAEDTYNIDPQKIEKLITKKTKAIIAVHLYGQSADMEEIQKIAKKYNLKIIEDSAQAHGALYRGKKIGSSGDVACFSFYPTKGLGAYGDGGMVITQDKSIYEKVLMLRDYGRVGRYNHVVKGYNSRLDTLQAIVLSAKLKHLDQWNKMRTEVAARYCRILSGIEGIKAPTIKNDRTHTFQTFAIRVKGKRDKVCEGLKAKGVTSLIHYPIPLHLQEAYKELGHKKGDFPVSEMVAGEILSLPMFPHMRKNQVEYVCSSIKDLMKNG